MYEQKEYLDKVQHEQEEEEEEKSLEDQESLLGHDGDTKAQLEELKQEDMSIELREDAEVVENMTQAVPLPGSDEETLRYVFCI